MAGVTTVALLERKPGISRSLFSRYWRDVHGVMAARIPGFDSYTQNHVSPLADVGSVDPEPFEGIAIVTIADEAHRQGLIESEVTRHIHRDEQNVFRRALLYNLAAGHSRILSKGLAGSIEIFFVVPHGQDGLAIANRLASNAAVDLHDLTSGDPAGWNDTDVGADRRFVALIHTHWSDDAAAHAATREVVAGSGGAVAAYRLDERHVMVEHGFPTAVGLRGLDAVRTIEEAGAVNQLEREVVTAIYGRLGVA
ncbi:MAG: hypothetical protein JWR77_2095 [Rhizorhabdus sp.]|nr:hypothetical protein [Rhizorhabdus sp.]